MCGAGRGHIWRYGALSTAVAGLIVVHAGYSAAFLVLAGISGLGLLPFLANAGDPHDLAVWPLVRGDDPRHNHLKMPVE